MGRPLRCLESPGVSPQPILPILYSFEFSSVMKSLKPRRKRHSPLRPCLLVLLLLVRTAVQLLFPFVTLAPRRSNRCFSAVPQRRRVCLLRKIALHKVIPPHVRKVLPHKATCPDPANLVKVVRVYLLPPVLVLQTVHLRHNRHSKARDASSSRFRTLSAQC